MVKKFMIGLLGFMLVGFTGCKLETPEIRGVVMDEETKQPVEAWLHTTLQIRTKTMQGPVISVLRVDPPHARSSKDGKFVIPAKKFEKPSFPAGLGTEIENFSMNASTIDDKSGGFYLKGYQEKQRIEITIYVKPWKEGLTNEREYFSYLQSLFNYCLVGRFGVEVPAVEGGCDNWEMDYAIIKHERYLKKFKNPKLIEEPPYGVSKFENIIHYSGIQRQLGNLLKKKGAYKKALNMFKELKEFDEKHGLSMHLNEYEAQLKELQQKIHEKQP
jgi:hypothetical protein